ncbi:hypothetical protein POX35_01995 [Escherichia fergusonii]|uniref:hypothetical protein n=1 Tax=Escherichia fergusonii TaxID=564 RepID=UPI002FF987DA
MSGSAFAVTHHAFSSGAGRTSDGNGSHASTLKSPSYTKSVSWQHYPVVNDNNETFDITNYIYTTKGTTNKDTTKDIDENDIHNDAKDDENNSIIRRRNFSGEIAIVAYT